MTTQNNDTPSLEQASAPTEGVGSPDNGGLAKDASVLDVLAYNPFKAGEKVPQDGSKDSKVASEGAATPAPNNTQAAAPVTPALLNKPDPQMDAIKAILMQTELGQGEQSVAAEPAAGADDFKVNWDVPPQMVDAMMSQEPAQVQAAIGSLINGVANGVLGMVQQKFQEIMSQGIPAVISQREQVQQLNSKFYGRHPYLQKPELTGTVAKVAGAYARQLKAANVPVDPMSDSFMDMVANYMVTQGFVAAPASRAPKQKQAPHFGNSGARPNNAERPTEDILSSIGL